METDAALPPGCVADRPTAWSDRVPQGEESTVVEPVRTVHNEVIEDEADSIEEIHKAEESHKAEEKKVEERKDTLAPPGARNREDSARKPSKQSVQSKSSKGSDDDYTQKARKPSRMSVGSQASMVSTASRKSLSRYGASRDDYKKLLKINGEPESEPMPENANNSHGDEESWQEYVETGVSLVFMVLVGLSMPALFGENGEDQSGGLSGGTIAFHIIVVSVLMVIGKMFAVFCYSEESNLKGRLALCLGMCPRGEVGASIIVISLDLGVTGPAIIIAIVALAANLVMTGGFIAAVKTLLKDAPPYTLDELIVQTPEIGASPV
jgi:hypothetical protein